MRIGMTKNLQEVYERLADDGIFGPGSPALGRHEKSLTRYFEKEYRLCLMNPQSLEALGVATGRGPIAEDTEALMSRHYDERPEFFTSFLDHRYRAYSMAYYGETPEAIRNSPATLDEAQTAKFSLIANRAQITGRERILNIGCGFGSLETYLLQEFPNIEISGVTPSKVQINYLKQRMEYPADPLCSDRFTLIEGAFEDSPIPILGKNKYDLVISIGVFEHLLSMRASLERFAALLAPGGKTFHHFITSQLAVPHLLSPEKTRIGQYFPGGRVWPHDELSQHTEHFELVNSWFVNGLNYWRTLDEWHQRYWNSIPDLYGAVFDSAAIKYWNEYFLLCKAMFAPLEGQFCGNSHYLFKLKG
jgi:cyclopropane-fatty-acyl-phospholipid synthase